MIEMKFEMLNGNLMMEKTVTIIVFMKRKDATEWNEIHWISTSEEAAFQDLYKHYPTKQYDYEYLKMYNIDTDTYDEIFFENEDKYCDYYVNVEDFLEKYKDYLYEADIVVG